uniref:Carboxylic ester hydrolase n=1 Tax=Anisakis simplex TaxID=6269 RepID=A0A0M3J535_ANISI
LIKSHNTGFLTASHRLLTGNFGLDDQIQAIRWLKENAPNFGGDSARITLAGESAGAACASLLAISPKTKGYLFSGVILRSGSALAPWAVRSTSTENNSARLMDYCGCRYNRTLGMTHIKECMQSIPVERFLNGWHHVAITSPNIVKSDGIWDIFEEQASTLAIISEIELVKCILEKRHF